MRVYFHSIITGEVNRNVTIFDNFFAARFGERTEKKIRENAPLIKAFNIINYAPEIERIADAKEAAHLGGVLDLFSP